MRWSLIPPPDDEAREGVPVSEIMSPNVVKVGPGSTVAEVARLMRDYGIGSVVVADDDKILGIVTERDLITRYMAKGDGRPPEEVKVDEIMTKNPVKIRQNVDVVEAAKIMAERNIRRLLVVDKRDRLVGVISSRDVVRVAPHIVFMLRERLRIAESPRGTFPI